mmetsp:Transcript_70288/g.81930  ORF Transcript_70288/g.81930 Transcript_70288/m.81930 type:complete len:173 (+) Transcript_70288:48-566(+)|eukprot:CAMPEP_0176429532 /NCGR_PEP_ID=MMETSP0127-20121128/13762_1 /TAXON_ID=938130 /ORGANISM="Platyophrya macrostoma, Strain WH" /LENGTH=172 /DNA_ID=CAMNT_0017811345 /DNA_START=48 /DNA_END=566 /DNA_ORIENTATION=-
MMDAYIKIQCKDGVEFNANKRILNFCKVLSSMPGFEDEHIKLELSGGIFQKVYEFCQHFNFDYTRVKGIQKPIQTSNFELITDEWCGKFFKSLSEDELGELMMASQYLQSQYLFDYACSFIACCFKDLTLEETKQKFEITEDITPDVEDQLKKEYGVIFKDLGQGMDIEKKL